jgi:tRNA U34 5-methylaminomethyl-2-thiouridine-forming methyltransferase MnmC
MNLQHPLFEIVRTTTGVLSIRNKVVNEIMHNPVGPWIEANTLYIDQSNLKKFLSEANNSEFVVYDVGLGAAANSLAILACANSLPESHRKLRIVSFEKDLELLRFALSYAEQFEHFHGYEAAIAELLKNKIWSSNAITWELREGDFVDLVRLEASKPHLIYFDPYSPRVNREMWSVQTFKHLQSRFRSLEEGGTRLYTYSQATPIRVAMIMAGFCVGRGQSTGLKKETTEAASHLQLLNSPLAQSWFDRWLKSQEPYPFETRKEDQDSVRAAVTSYMQRHFQDSLKVPAQIE